MNAFTKTCTVPAFVTAWLLLSSSVSAQFADTGPAPTPTPELVQPAGTKLPFTIGKDTTVITTPLKADGTPDYLAAVEAAASKGVTLDSYAPGNNAAVLLVSALGPKVFLNPQYATKTMELLHIGVDETLKPLDLEALNELPQEARDAAMAGPWKATDHPQIAEWLQANGRAMQLGVKASERSRFYLPLMPAGHQGLMMEVLMPNMAPVRALGRALIMRSNLALGEGRVSDAWDDIKAVDRLGSLLGQDSTLIGRLASIVMTSMADKAAIRLATSGKLDQRTARAALAAIQSLPPTAEVISVVDGGERFVTLDALIHLARATPAGRRELLGMVQSVGRVEAVQASRPSNSPAATSSPTPAGTSNVDHATILASLTDNAMNEASDWDAGLRRVNEYYDRAVAAMRISDLGKRQEAAQSLSKWLEDLQHSLRTVPEPGTQAYRDYVPKVVLSILAPSLNKAQLLTERAANDRRRAIIAIALASYKADQGRYPAKLADLAGKYIKQVPQDAWGKPFVYKAQDKDYVLTDPNETIMK